MSSSGISISHHNFRREKIFKKFFFSSSICSMVNTTCSVARTIVLLCGKLSFPLGNFWRIRPTKASSTWLEYYRSFKLKVVRGSISRVNLSLSTTRTPDWLGTNSAANFFRLVVEKMASPIFFEFFPTIDLENLKCWDYFISIYHSTFHPSYSTKMFISKKENNRPIASLIAWGEFKSK